MSGDQSQWRALLTCVQACVAHSAAPERLLFHVACARGPECTQFDRYATRALPEARHQLRLVPFDARALVTRLSRSSSAARNLSAPHNYVRFHLAALLPASVHRVLWLDNDLVVRRDIAPLLADAHLFAAGEALAAVVQRRPLAKSMIRRIFNGLEGKPFGKKDSSGQRPRSLNMRHGAVLDALLPRAAHCRQTQQNCFHFNAGVLLMQLDQWRRLNITASIEKWLAFLSDNEQVAVGLTQPPLVFYFWDNVVELPRCWNWGSADDIHDALRDSPDSIRDAILHFNGDRKPWLDNNTAAYRLWSQYAPALSPSDHAP